MISTFMDKKGKRGIQIIRDMVSQGIISKYKLAREMGVSDTAVDDWVLGKYFNEDRHMLKLLEVRDKFMRIRGFGVWADR